MWRYTLNDSIWTWMFGPNTRGANSVYGTLGVANPSSTPGAIKAHKSWFVVETREYWCFGGSRYAGMSFSTVPLIEARA
jgi:hypothetical protein